MQTTGETTTDWVAATTRRASRQHGREEFADEHDADEPDHREHPRRVEGLPSTSCTPPRATKNQPDRRKYERPSPRSFDPAAGVNSPRGGHVGGSPDDLAGENSVFCSERARELARGT